MKHRKISAAAVIVLLSALSYAAWHSARPAPDPEQCNASDPDTRIEGCNALIALSEKSPDLQAAAYLKRGVAYRLKGQFDKAIADYNAALRINPHYAEAYNNRGDAQDALGQYDKAIADADMALKIKPDLAAAYDTRGQAKIHRGDVAGGQEDLAMAKDLGLK